MGPFYPTVVARLCRGTYKVAVYIGDDKEDETIEVASEETMN
jgi:hypothetical protein